MHIEFSITNYLSIPKCIGMQNITAIMISTLVNNYILPKTVDIIAN